MLDIGFYERFHELIAGLDENTEYTADEMFAKLEAIRSKDPVVYNIETTNRCNMRCKMCPRTTMMTRCNEDIDRETFLNVVDQIRPHTDEEWAKWKAFCEKTYGIYIQNIKRELNAIQISKDKAAYLHGNENDLAYEIKTKYVDGFDRTVLLEYSTNLIGSVSFSVEINKKA